MAARRSSSVSQWIQSKHWCRSRHLRPLAAVVSTAAALQNTQTAAAAIIIILSGLCATCTPRRDFVDSTAVGLHYSLAEDLCVRLSSGCTIA